MTNDIPFERWPTSAKAVIESATAGDPDCAQTEIRRESMRASELERVEQLWLPRLYRKIPRQRCPEPWRQLRADYTKRWCESTGTSPECEWDRDPSRGGPGGLIPDLDAIRCIVLGWADGIDPEELRRWVTRWRDEIEPDLHWLDPVTSRPAPGPLEYAYVTEELPAVRAQLGQFIDSLPDSPPAIQGLLSDLGGPLKRLRGPMVESLRCLEEHSIPDPAKEAPDDQGSEVSYLRYAIALEDEVAGLHRLMDRGARLEALLAAAERGLEETGFRISDGKLKETRPRTCGPKLAYLTQVVRGLYIYLRPFYRRTFDDHRLNPEPLRGQISRLLSPFFAPADISPKRGRKIANVINNWKYASS